MMRRRKLKLEQETVQPKGFDDYELKLGDMMRGERATMGKSLLDVQRELRIKASYIAAIENSDPDAFETPGFIAGYVRSYARYLDLDPDRAFAQFCAESGFEIAHGMSEAASGVKRQKVEPVKPKGVDALGSSTAFLPEKESFFSQIEPGALGSVAVLVALIGALGYGGWSILTEVQRVKFAPVEQAPEVLSDLDPIQAVPGSSLPAGPASVSTTGRAAEGLDRLYRPEALDVPVLVARDAPISTLNPSENGAFVDETQQAEAVVPGSAEDRAVALALAGATAGTEPTPTTPQVTETLRPGVTIVAVRPAWVRVSAADGTVVFEKILDAGEEYAVPMMEEPPLLRAGMSGSLYASVNGELRGPLGPGTATIRNVALAADQMADTYSVADLSSDPVAQDIMLAKARQLETPTE
ncbi:helix-turn-helix domain-containing protein [Pseudooceanicola onchidii]|uniref:helix-turn-helix domain-containing protein n=1 Tax=Pseudooceanicola onchidii TaxID=2562279 RepID=UPI0010A9CB6B|nr:helix-turn-helix domain-containing protein [Pseudooceanicola onchidii]